MEKQSVYIVSACLLGLCTRYDGKTKTSEECLKKTDGGVCIPVCPEQLGGMPTPREAADVIGGTGLDVLAGKAKVLTKGGDDVTSYFIKGAEQALQIIRRQDVSAIYLKSGSPSCGVVEKLGVTAALLQKNGYRVEEL